MGNQAPFLLGGREGISHQKRKALSLGVGQRVVGRNMGVLNKGGWDSFIPSEVLERSDGCELGFGGCGLLKIWRVVICHYLTFLSG